MVANQSILGQTTIITVKIEFLILMLVKIFCWKKRHDCIYLQKDKPPVKKKEG